MASILVVDDDAEIRTLLQRYLRDQGFSVRAAQDRAECRSELSRSRPDLIVLDVMLPDGSGLEICRALSEQTPKIPVILLTALSEEIDRIVGLELGADDYLGKPFNPRELVARIKAVLRRSAPDVGPAAETAEYQLGGVVVNVAQRSVTDADGAEIELTPAEFDLFHVFLERPGRLLSRDLLLDLTRGRDHDPLDRSVDVLMSRLRRKLSAAMDGPVFKTVRNGGYQLVVSTGAAGGTSPLEP